MKRRAGIYTRLSRDANRLSTSTRDQEKECRALARKLGWEVTDLYSDNDVPASEAQATRKRKRREYARLLRDLEEGRINTVLAWHPDRLYRHPRDLEDLITLLDGRNVLLRTVQAGDLDLSTADGRAMARVVVAFSKREVEIMGDRQARKNRSRAAEGLPHGGQRPFGYGMKQYTDPSTGVTKYRHTNKVVPKEAKAIVDAARRVLDGQSTSSVARIWNDAGFRGGRDNKWNHQTVTQVLTNPRIVGVRVHKPEKGERTETKAAWPAILDRRTFDKLQAALDPDARRSGWPGVARHTLIGLAFCGVCGERLVTRYSVGKRNYGCCTFIRADPLEEFVLTTALQMELDEPARVPEPDDPTRVDIDDVQKRMNDLADMLATGDLERTQFVRANAKLRARLEELEGVLSEHARPRKFSWKALAAATEDIVQTRAWLEEIVQRVVVKPVARRRNVSVADRVEIVWRPGVVPIDAG